MPSYRLQYAGEDILRPSASLTDVMDRWLERHAPPLYSHPGWDTRGLDHLPLPPKPKPRPPRLNVLDWPVGVSRWGSFHGLVGSAAFAAIRAAVGALSPVSAEFSIEEVDATGAAADLIRVPMWVVDVRPVFCSDVAAEAGQELFLLTLADRRYWAWQRTLEYEFEPCDTWLELLQFLYHAALGGSMPTPTTSIETEYGIPWPLRWTRPGVPLPLLMDAAAAQVGRKFVFRPTTASENCDLRTAADALTQDGLRWDAEKAKCVAGGYEKFTPVLAGNTPAGWAVGFPGDEQTVQSGVLADLALAEYGSITGVDGKKVWLRADTRADEASTALAELMATQWYLWALSPTDATFRGILEGDASNPSGLEDRVEWRYLPPDTDRRTVYQPGTAPTDIPAPGLDIVRDQVLTTVVPADRADCNLYGDRPPPGYTYSVKVTARDGDTMTATIRVIDRACSGGSGSDTEEVIDGPELGYGTGGYVLYRDPLADPPAVGDVGVAVPDPLVPNRWIFQGAAGGSGASQGECRTDAWLKHIKDDPPPCWTFYHRGGSGPCECFPLEDPYDPLAGIVGLYVDSLGGWLGVRQNNGGDDAMIQTCCGCGSGLLTIIPNAASGSRATFTIGGIHIPCVEGSGSGSDTTPFSITLTDYCIVDLTDGRRGILFQGYDERACTGLQDDCINEFNILAVCGETCPSPRCGCAACATLVSPVAWLAQGIIGFPDDSHNGDWIWVQDQDPESPCTWTATCTADGSSSSLTVVVDGTDLVWRLTHGGAVYEKVADGFDCGDDVDDMILTKVSGDGPDTVTLIPITAIPDGTIPPACCNGCDWEELITKTLYLTILGSGTSLDGTTLSATYNPTLFGDTGGWQFDGEWEDCDCEPTGVRGLLGCTGGKFSMAATVGELGPCMLGFDSEQNPSTQCDPLLIVADGLLSTGCPGTGTIPCTITITETAP